MPRFLISQHALIVKHLGEEMRKAAKRALESAALRTVQHIVVDIIPKEEFPPVDRGAYRAGWKAKPIPEGALVYNRVPYAPIVEYGARAANIKIGRKMIAALAEWARRKGLTGSTIEANRIAWAIAKTFQQRGIFKEGRGLRILEKAGVSIPRFIKEEFEREMAKAKL